MFALLLWNKKWKHVIVLTSRTCGTIMWSEVDLKLKSLIKLINGKWMKCEQLFWLFSNYFIMIDLHEFCIVQCNPWYMLLSIAFCWYCVIVKVSIWYTGAINIKGLSKSSYQISYHLTCLIQPNTSLDWLNHTFAMRNSKVVHYW